MCVGAILPHAPAVPHTGAAQSTPALALSKVTAAVIVAVVPTATDAAVGVAVTAIGAIVTVALTCFVASLIELAVSVTVPPDGIVFGAV